MDTLVGSVCGKFREVSPHNNNGYTTCGRCQKRARVIHWEMSNSTGVDQWVISRVWNSCSGGQKA